MNNQLIQKVIKSDDGNACPEFTYENPLLDRNVAGALARSFVKVLSVSQQDSNINNNLRHSILANIRKICRLEPENHMDVDENFTNSMTKVYVNEIKESQRNASINTIERSLDEFILRIMKEVNLNSSFQPTMNPEVVQALLNLSENSSKLVSSDVLHWDVSDKKYLAIIKDLWSNSSLAGSTTVMCDDISIKMKSEIEIILLNFCHSSLTDPNLQIEELFTNITLKDLVKKSSKSSECFQICSKIMNYLFIHTNYNPDIENFISKFIQKLKEHCSNSISVLYPINLRPIVVLLDIDLDVLPQQLKSKYVRQTLVNLKKCHEENNNDLVLLLSHFPEWFLIYIDLDTNMVCR